MFISKQEKTMIVGAIKTLQEQVRDLTAKVVIMGKFPEARATKSGKARTMSPEARAKMSAMMKKRHADAKAQKEQA
jgi:hypothetical protein